MIELLYRHFYRDCIPEDEDKVYLSYCFHDILAAVQKHELHQMTADEEAGLARQGRKRKEGPGGLDDAKRLRDDMKKRLRTQPPVLAKRDHGKQ